MVKFLKIVFFIGVLLAWSGEVLATGYYVNDGSLIGDVWCNAIGNDISGTGSITKPFSTLKKALTLVGSGDIIYIDAGTYVDVNYTFKSNLTIIGAGSALTYLKGSGSGVKPCSNIDGISNLTIKNIKIGNFVNNPSGSAGSSDTGFGEAITITNSSNIKFYNVLWSPNSSNAGDPALCIGSNSTNILLDGSTSACQGSSVSNGAGIKVEGKLGTGIATNVSLTVINSLISGVYK